MLSGRSLRTKSQKTIASRHCLRVAAQSQAVTSLCLFWSDSVESGPTEMLWEDLSFRCARAKLSINVKRSSW
eukprot:5992755-Amphidinium_carterae.1